MKLLIFTVLVLSVNAGAFTLNCRQQSDCKLIYSSCGCMALSKESKEDILADSTSCRVNKCKAQSSLEAVCEKGVCRRNDGRTSDPGNPKVGAKPASGHIDSPITTPSNIDPE